MPENTVRFTSSSPTTSSSLIKESGFDIIKEKPLKPQQDLEEFAVQVQRSILRTFSSWRKPWKWLWGEASSVPRAPSQVDLCPCWGSCCIFLISLVQQPLIMQRAQIFCDISHLPDLAAKSLELGFVLAQQSCWWFQAGKCIQQRDASPRSAGRSENSGL